MSRLRRVDRLILAECCDDTILLDTDDQDLLISQLSAKNDSSHALYTRILVLSVVAEMPVLTFLIRLIVVKQVKYIVHFILLSLLCLIGALYDVTAVGNQLSSNRRLPQDLIRGILSFKLLCVVHGLLLIQFYMAIYRQHGFQLHFVFLLLPLINFVSMIMVRLWYTQTAIDIRRLYDLRYKFKSI